MTSSIASSPRSSLRSRAALIALVSLVSCAPPEAPGAELRMDFARTTSLYDAPFPSADLVGPDGVVDVSGLPAPMNHQIVGQIEQALVGIHGFGATSAIHFQLSEPPTTTLLTLRPDPSDTTVVVQLVDVDPDSPDVGQRIPLELFYADDAGPFANDEHILTALPVQGWPLRPSTTYAAVVLDTLLTATGNRYTPSAAMRALRDGHPPDAMNATSAATYAAAVTTLGHHHVDIDHVIGMTVFRTQDPTAVFSRGLESVRGRDTITLDAPLTLEETYDSYCVYHTTAHVPDYQQGTPPYTTDGGGWRFDESGGLVVDHTEQANILVTIPRTTMPTDGFPLVTLIRTGAGGDRPLVDRGIDTGEHMGSTPGTGPAMHFAAEGIAGIQIDGPHGGLRNITMGDEQFLVFNIENPTALRDNLRESALELDLLVDLLDTLRIDGSGCMGLDTHGQMAKIDTRQLALLGHSMGASIAPLAAAFEPRYRAIILSGSGASWTENIMYKESPIDVRPVAASLLGYRSTHPLREDDPIVNLLQWAGEEADAAVYAPLLVREATSSPRHILMFQGIVDTYITLPIANAMTISTGLDLGGPVLDRNDPRTAPYQSVTDILPLRGRMEQAFPVTANLTAGDGTMVTGAVVQHMQDGIEDGHEVMWQLPDAQTQYRCFLRSFLRDPAPSIVDPAVGCP